MEPYLKITYLNDFVFCPLSIYYHELYGYVKPILYHEKPQIDGKAAHETIDSATYSTHSDVLQGMNVYSEKLKICGCIDVFDIKKALLTERKKKITTIYDGYVFQLYAQYYCLIEMGYVVNFLRFWSKDDNKIHWIELPDNDEVMKMKFFESLESIRLFDPSHYIPTNGTKCAHCIYRNFCDRPLEELC